MITSNPFVSIIVITYNSAKFIFETLESAKAQTYKNIELIVSDDCSTDNTVEICRNWLKENEACFINAELVIVAKNTGIPANCNRGIVKAKGEWIKLIAGDDLLTENAIETLLAYSQKKSESVCFFGTIGKFVHPNWKVIENHPLNYKHKFYSENTSVNQQFKYFLNNPNLLTASGMYVKLATIKQLGGFDETYKLMEDFPFCFRMLSSGIKLSFIKEVTVLKRNNPDSVAQSHFLTYKKGLPVINEYNKTLFRVHYELAFPKYSIWRKLEYAWIYSFLKIVLFLGNKGWVAWFIFRYLVLIKPSSIPKRITSKIKKI